MPDTEKREMSLRVESAMDRNGHLTEIVLVPQDDRTNDWLYHNMRSAETWSEVDWRSMRWTVTPKDQLSTLLSNFMRAGGVIG